MTVGFCCMVFLHQTLITGVAKFKKKVMTEIIVFIHSIKAIYIQVPEKAMAPHSSTLAWKIPWMEEPGRLQSVGSLIVRHD